MVHQQVSQAGITFSQSMQVSWGLERSGLLTHLSTPSRKDPFPCWVVMYNVNTICAQPSGTGLSHPLGVGSLVTPGCLLCSQLKQLAISDTCVVTSSHGVPPLSLSRCRLCVRLSQSETLCERM